jgi:ceroid-lipofuscinosis MFS transporter 7
LLLFLGNEQDEHQQLSKKTIWVLFCSFLAINFLFRAILGTMETLASTLYDDVYGADSAVTRSAMSSGYFYAILGLVGLCFMLPITIFAKYFRDYPVLLLAMATAVLGNCLLIAEPDTISHAQFIVGVGLIWSVAFPLSQTVLVSLFSRIPGSSQAVRMSWIGSAGSLGRIAGPIVSGLLYGVGGMVATFSFTTALGAATCLLPLVLFKYLRYY